MMSTPTTTTNNRYPAFSKDEFSLLLMACAEEIKYWKRMHLTGLSPNMQTETKHKFLKKYPGFGEAINEAKQRNIDRYHGLASKIRDKENEYTAEDIHWLKIMCQERIPQIKKHMVIKEQIDGTASYDYADTFLKDCFEDMKKSMIEQYSKLAERLSKMDTLPGEGLHEPHGFRFKI